MKTIRATSGETIIVDEADYGFLSQWSWGINSTGYARRTIRKKANPGGFGTLLMHHLILCPPPGFESDHINGNKLDNRRSNLRIVARSINVQRRRIRASRKPKSGFRGVEVRSGGGRRFSARICKDGVRIQLGSFYTAKEAALAYDKAALELFGPLAEANRNVRRRGLG